MPNWCENRWNITATDEVEAQEIFDLMTQAHETEPNTNVVTFNKLLPMPAILENLSTGEREIEGQKLTEWFVDWDDEGKPISRTPTPLEKAEIDALEIKGWYDWRVTQWGTKWDANSGSATLDGDCIELRFDTAWGPPQGVYDALYERFPTVSFSAFYDEPGMQFAGYLE